MDVGAITSAITTVGFPVVMCGCLFWYMVQQGKEHKEEVGKMTEAVNNNTLALQHLADVQRENK